MRVRFFSTAVLITSALWIAAAARPGAAGEGKRVSPGSIRVVPDNATVWGAQGSQHFMVLAKYADGLERDVTSATRFSLSQPAKGEIDTTGKFVARSPGEVEETEKPRPFTFAREIDGIFTKRGCNDALCHGGVKERGGFKLSVYGIYPHDDYKWAVQGGTFRVLTTDEAPKHPRINLKEPEKSLLLLKPTFSVPQGGGLRLKVGSEDYQTIVNWIRAGAPYGEEAEKQGVMVKRVEVSPQEVVLEPGSRQQLVVTAYLSNGRQEDITDRVRYISNDAGVAEASDGGIVQGKKTGETNIL